MDKIIFKASNFFLNKSLPDIEKKSQIMDDKIGYSNKLFYLNASVVGKLPIRIQIGLVIIAGM